MNFRQYVTKQNLKPIAQVLGSQMVGKAIGFIISILLVRELPKEEYAIYTVLITIQGMLIPLSNSAIFIGFKKIAGKIWMDERELSNLIKTANRIVPYITAIAYLLVGAYAGVILYKQDITTLRIVGFLLLLLLIVIAAVKTQFFTSTLLLRKKVGPVQVSELIGHLVRALGIVAVLFLFRESYTIIFIFLVTAISGWATYFYVNKKVSDEGISSKGELNLDYRTILLKYIKLNWHNSAFFAFKNQISIFLLGVFGTTTSLADIGALSRFALIFTIISALFGNIYAPAFARTQKLQKLKTMFVYTFISICVISFGVCIVGYLLPEPFLWLLGDNYQELSYELVLVLINGSMGFMLGIVYSINLYKAWIRFTPALEIPVDIIGIVIGIFLFDITTLIGVLYMGIFSAALNLLLHIFNSLAGLGVLGPRFAEG